MARFDPFKKVNSRYGAPMGRAGDDPVQFDGASKLYARNMGGDGVYDRGGAYWGLPGDVWAVWTRGGGYCVYVRATSHRDALAQVMRGRFTSVAEAFENDELEGAALEQARTFGLVPREPFKISPEYTP